VNRLGYGAMQIAGPGVFGPPRNKAAATSTDLMLRTSWSGRRCILIPRISSSSRRSVQYAAPWDHPKTHLRACDLLGSPPNHCLRRAEGL